jgi:8-oxo-dGTP pyrophosphatase MutT (NUDIX family)
LVRPAVLEIERRLRSALVGPLPGLTAHLRMAPRPRPGWRPAGAPDEARPAAALLLLVERAEGAHLVLTVRSMSLVAHAGQVSLPGGAIDRGETIEEAALREGREEIGVEPEAVRVVGRLSPLHIPVSGFLLHPVVGVSTTRPLFRPALAEVDRILEVPLAHLIDRSRIGVDRWTRDGVLLDVPYFHVEGQRVWGATAMVLAELLALLGHDPDPWAG